MTLDELRAALVAAGWEESPSSVGCWDLHWSFDVVLYTDAIHRTATLYDGLRVWRCGACPESLRVMLKRACKAARRAPR